LGACDLILAHCERLITYFQAFAPAAYVDHHGKYTLAETIPYREKGYVLWIGQLTHAPWVLRYLAKEPIPYEVRLLTRLKDDRGRSRAAALAEHLGIQCDITDHWIGPFRAFNWNEVVQNRMMRECKAALDIKGGAEDFSQWTKPATKAQKYVSSGIPVALNQDSYSAEYFRSRGFPLASPSEERWFTRAYWEETQAAARVLRPRLALEAVALRYRELFDKVLNGNCTEISAVASPITADNNAEKPASARFENKPAP
jgi:hypothetical protein